MRFSGSLALSEAWGLFRGRFGPLLAVAVLYYVLLAIVMAVFGATMMSDLMMMNGGAAAPGGFGFGMVVLYLLIYGIGFFHQSASVRLCSARHEASLGDAMAIGVRSVPTLFGVAILAIIGLIALVVVLSLVTAGVMAGTNSGGMGFVLGLLMLGGFVYLGMRLSMILPVVANEEQRNPIAAIARSWALTKGSALKLFLLFVVVALVMGAIGLLMFMLTIGIPRAGAVPNAAGMIGLFIAMVVFGLTIGIYFIALIAAIHNQLSGPAVAEMAETFA